MVGTPETRHCRTLIFPLPAGIYCKKLVRDETWCLPLLLRAGWDYGLNLWRSRVYCHSLCEFTCASVLRVWKTLFPWSHPLPLALRIFLLLPHNSLSLEGRGLMKASHLGLSSSKSLLSAHCPILGLCVNSYLL